MALFRCCVILNPDLERARAFPPFGDWSGQRINLPQEFQDYAMGKMANSTMEIRTRYGLTMPFVIERGVPQDAPSPLFFLSLAWTSSMQGSTKTLSARMPMTPIALRVG